MDKVSIKRREQICIARLYHLLHQFASPRNLAEKTHIPGSEEKSPNIRRRSSDDLYMNYFNEFSRRSTIISLANAVPAQDGTRDNRTQVEQN